jgi:Ca-activated chloride channel family protein
VGTEAGELIPIPDGAGGTHFVKDPEGNFVKSRLDSDMLTQIAAATGGVYTPLGPQGQGVVSLYEQRLKGFAQRQHGDRQVAVYAELFQWPMGVAIALLILEWLLGVSVRRRAWVTAPANAVRASALLIALALIGAPRAWSSPLTAQEEYDNGQYAQAQRDYVQSLKEDPSQTRLQFNLGTAAYKAGDFTTAASAFNNALKTRDVPLQQSAYYNLANTLFRQGEKGAMTDPQSTMKTWQQAIGAYDTALQIKPSDRDAKFNRDVVQMRLAQLQREQQKKQNQNQNQNDKNKDQDQQDQKNQQKSQGGGQQDQRKQAGQQGPPDQRNAQNQPQPQNQQPPQNQPGQQNPQNSQQQPEQQPSGPTQAQPDQQGAQKPQQLAAAAQDIGKPNEMTRLEAEQLLDSAKGEERHLGVGVRDGKPENRPATPLKDW